MNEKEDASFGVVPLIKVGAEYYVLLVHQISYRGDRFWIFPKGHAEEGESPLQAAQRELAEETGVTDITLEPSQIFSVSYNFIHEETRINKKVDYYLGYCLSKSTEVTQPHEIAELRWCTFIEAQQLLTHKNSREVLLSVASFLEQKINDDF
jgi:8-oxo-dGTP pyrophosphatase MutT (NUDIX family)